MTAARAKVTNWASADAGPGRALDDICLVDWDTPESFRRQRAAWLRSVRCVGDVRLSNMVWLLHVLAGFMKHKNDSAWPSIPRLAAELNWSEPTVKRALAQAIEWGWLVRERRYDKSNRYSMSFSRAVRAEIEDRHELRVAPFENRGPAGSARDSNVDVDGDEIKPELTVGSNLISPSDQVGSHPEIKPDPLYRLEIPSRDTVDPSLTDPLGDRVQDRSQGGQSLPSESPSTVTPDEPDDGMAAREEVIAQLAGGDLRLGRRLAEFVAPKAIDHLVAMVAAEGIVPCADAIASMARMAREAAAREAAAIENPSKLEVQT